MSSALSASPMALPALQAFAPASPRQAESRALLRRYDTKFLLKPGAVDGWLSSLANDYDVLPAGDQRLASYSTLYFDTPERRSFLDHARGRLPRYKVRIRHYPDRQVSYLEVKEKTNHFQTRKQRRKRAFGNDILTDQDREFLGSCLPFSVATLQPVLWTDFRRVSLVARATEERVTLDLHMTFRREGTTQELPGVALVEVKQGRFSRHTVAMRQLHALHAHPSRFSKYCIGTALAPGAIKINALRRQLRSLERMSHA